MIAALLLSAALLGQAAAPRAPTVPARGSVYERKSVGLVVIDVKDSTPLYQAEGNKRAHAAIMGVLDRAEAVAALHKGVVMRRLGDGQLLVFPTLEQALDAAAVIQQSVHSWRRGHSDSPVKLRASVHAGRVLFDGAATGSEVYGQNVERALRLTAAGDGGDIAVSRELAGEPAVRRLASGAVVTQRQDAVLIKPPSLTAAAPAAPLQPPLTVSRMTVAAALFATLDGWSDVYEKRGRRNAYAVVKAFHEHVRRTVTELGGEIVKTQGETIMAAFASPADALAAAARIQRRMDEVRQATPLGSLARAKIGVNYGRMLRQDRLEGTDYYGNRVNAAARLMHLARPDEILVGASLLENKDAAALLRTARRETVALKGFGALVEALRMAVRPERPRPRAVRRLRDLAERARARVVGP